MIMHTRRAAPTMHSPFNCSCEKRFTTSRSRTIMPPKFYSGVGGSDMKFLVASLFLLMSVILLAAIAPAQTTHRRVSNSTLKKPRDATVKICQGLPIPDGYIVTAYMTTSACPHGAYVIKKQDTDSESSVAPGKKQNTESESESSVPANK